MDTLVAIRSLVDFYIVFVSGSKSRNTIPDQIFSN